MASVNNAGWPLPRRIAPFIWERPEGAHIHNGLNFYPADDRGSKGWILRIGPFKYRNRLSLFTGIRYKGWYG